MWPPVRYSHHLTSLRSPVKHPPSIADSKEGSNLWAMALKAANSLGRRARGALRVGVPIAAALGGLVALKLLLPGYVQKQQLVAFFEPMGVWAPVVFLLVLAVRPAALIPGQLLCAVGGMIFGTFWGSAYALIGSVLSTSLLFLVASRVGSGPMRKIWGQRYDAVHAVARSHDFRFAAVCTLNPLLPTDPIVVVMAASGTRYWRTILGVLAGTIPGTIVTAHFGAALTERNPWMTAAAGIEIAASLALGMVLGRTVVRELRREQRRQRAASAHRELVGAARASLLVPAREVQPDA